MVVNNFVNSSDISAWNKEQCQHHDGVYLNCGLPNRWYELDCVDFPNMGIQECSGSCLPLNYGSFTACRPSNMEYDGAHAGIIYHILTIPSPSSKPANQPNKNTVLYTILALILLTSISLMVLII